MPSTMTRTQLVNKAGANLNVLSAGQSLSAEDEAAIDAHVDPLVMQLATDGIVDVIADVGANEIPPEFFLGLAACLADAAKAEFGRAGDQALMAARLEAQVTLRRLCSTPPTYE